MGAGGGRRDRCSGVLCKCVRVVVSVGVLVYPLWGVVPLGAVVCCVSLGVG